MTENEGFQTDSNWVCVDSIAQYRHKNTIECDGKYYTQVEFVVFETDPEARKLWNRIKQVFGLGMPLVRKATYNFGFTCSPNTSYYIENPSLRLVDWDSVSIEELPGGE